MKIPEELKQIILDKKAALATEAVLDRLKQEALGLNICPDCGGELYNTFFYLLSSIKKCKNCNTAHKYTPYTECWGCE